MLDIQGRQISLSGSRVNRRDFVRVGALGMAGLTLADWLQMQARGEVSKQPQAKAVIQLWMAGGPTHLDTFDPKPEPAPSIAGPTAIPFKPTCRASSSASLPLLAKQADKYAVIRSITHGDNGHETATYVMQTCTMPGELAYPSLGAVVAYKKNAGRLPGPAALHGGLLAAGPLHRVGLPGHRLPGLRHRRRSQLGHGPRGRVGAAGRRDRRSACKAAANPA